MSVQRFGVSFVGSCKRLLLRYRCIEKSGHIPYTNPLLTRPCLIRQSLASPGSFQGPLHVLGAADGFVAAVRTNALAGGDSCSRAAFIAACFAAQVCTLLIELLRFP